MNSLPIDHILPNLLKALETNTSVVLQAPPGAGKTTRVPLALLEAPWRKGGKILMLEPRRLAARSAAARMSETLGENVGDRVGYRVQLDSKVGKNTLIEVVTEGILTRRLQRDPELEGVAAVIFDEFHERSLNADLGLALCLDVQAGLREDLRVLVMSATLDAGAVAAIMDEAPVITSEGRSYPVDIKYLGDPLKTSQRGRSNSSFMDTLSPAIVSAVHLALKEEAGNILVFLPGEGEIRRVEKRLIGSALPKNVAVMPLYGALPQSKQDQALRPTPPSQRKIVLATSIAETSLTIEGIRIVIDGGQSREPRFDPQSGMTRLVTEAVSLASATQRTGRAGRLEPGVCYRLWDKAGEGAYRQYRLPEIANADLAPVALDLASWGLRDANSIKWLTPPPEAPLSQARALLHRLGALDQDGSITPHGREMAMLPMHPRLAHMVLEGAKRGWSETACALAALLSERDIAMRQQGEQASVDLNLRLAAFRGEKTSLAVDTNALNRARVLAKHWLKRMPKPTKKNHSLTNEDVTGALVAFAYPDRLAGRRKGGEPRYHQSNGKGAVLAKEDGLRDAPFLAVAEVTGENRDARIRTAAPISLACIELLFQEQITNEQTAVWDRQSRCVIARKQQKLQALVLTDVPADTLPKAQISQALCQGIGDLGLDCLPWTPEARQWCQRVRCLYQNTGKGPNLSELALRETLETWLLPYLNKMTRIDHLKSIDLLSTLKTHLNWSEQQDLDKTVPSHFTVASGSKIAIDYTNAAAPVLPVKLQEMFGTTETPSIIGGSLALTIHLLSPARHPLQITQDLAAFWKSSYPQVKSEMKGRYPKHPWPDDPLSAVPSRHTKNRMSRKPRP